MTSQMQSFVQHAKLLDPRCVKLWTCPNISAYWDRVLQRVNLIAVVQIPKEGVILLFHYDDDHNNPSSVHIPSWAHLAFLIAKRYIMKDWLLNEQWD